MKTELVVSIALIVLIGGFAVLLDQIGADIYLQGALGALIIVMFGLCAAIAAILRRWHACGVFFLAAIILFFARTIIVLVGNR